MKTLVKSYRSRYIILELRYFRNGYCIIKLVKDHDEWNTEWRHSSIKGLDRASTLMFEYLIEEELAHPFTEFSIYSKH